MIGFSIKKNISHGHFILSFLMQCELPKGTILFSVTINLETSTFMYYNMFKYLSITISYKNILEFSNTCYNI